MANIDSKIVMKWTQKGLDAIDDASTRQIKAITLMGTYIGLKFTHSAQATPTTPAPGDLTITLISSGGETHIEWLVSGDREDIRDFAHEMESHGYVTAVVKRL